MIPPQLIVAGIIATASAATGFGAAWQIQSWRSDAKELQHAEIALENQRLIAAARARNDQALIDAASAGVARGIAIRRDSDSTRSAVVGLRDDTQAFVRNAAAEPATCPDRTATLGELFNTMAAAGGEFTQKADHHVNDIRTMREAAPKLIRGPDQ
jgi:hypothetical protein